MSGRDLELMILALAVAWIIVRICEEISED